MNQELLLPRAGSVVIPIPDIISGCISECKITLRVITLNKYNFPCIYKVNQSHFVEFHGKAGSIDFYSLMNMFKGFFLYLDSSFD